MRVFGYLEATKHGQYGVLDGLLGPRHLVLTREANQSLLILLAKIVRPSPNGNLGQRTNVSVSLPKRLLKLGPKQGN